MVADFESLQTKVDEKTTTETEVNDEEGTEQKIKTKKLTKHKTISYGIQIYDQHNILEQTYYEHIAESDEDNVVHHFLETVKNISQQIEDIIKNTNEDVIITEEQ